MLASDGREGKEGGSSSTTTEELELELEALDIADEPLELEGTDEAENEELAKKLMDEQGESGTVTSADPGFTPEVKIANCVHRKNKQEKVLFPGLMFFIQVLGIFVITTAECVTQGIGITFTVHL